MTLGLPKKARLTCPNCKQTYFASIDVLFKAGVTKILRLKWIGVVLALAIVTEIIAGFVERLILG